MSDYPPDALVVSARFCGLLCPCEIVGLTLSYSAIRVRQFGGMQAWRFPHELVPRTPAAAAFIAGVRSDAARRYLTGEPSRSRAERDEAITLLRRAHDEAIALLRRAHDDQHIERGIALSTEPWDQIEEEVRQLGRRSEDWDGEGADAPRRESIEGALRFCSTAARMHRLSVPNCVSLARDGNLLLEWHLPSVYFELEFVASNRAEMMRVPAGRPGQHENISF